MRQSKSQILSPAPGVTLDMIVGIVCDRMDRSRADVVGKGDGSGVTLRARHIVMWMARRLLRIPHAEIGANLSGREAGQVMNAEARINALRCADPKAQVELNEIELEIRAAGLAAEKAGLHLRPTVDAVSVARRVNFNARAATQVSVAEIQALAAHVLQNQSEPAYV